MNLLRHFLDVMSGKVPLATPLLCLRPGCNRTRDKVNGAEAQILAGRGHIRCRCGSRMRQAPGTEVVVR